MFRRSKVAGLSLLAVLILAAPAPADEVAHFLERFGLRDLLAVHLEQKLESPRLDDEERERLIVQLADLYAALLETVEDTERRHSLEERSRRLLAQAPVTSGDQLRLALVGGAYRSAERIAENHRLRLASPAELETARATLSEAIITLQQFRQRLDDRLQAAQRRLSRASGGQAAIVGDEVEQLLELEARATFLAAWALYYQSFLNDRPDNARVAEDLFATLLGLESAHGRPDDVSIDRRGFEAYARAILGMALCKSLTSQVSTALAWVRLLEHPETFDALRTQVPAWQLVVLLEHREFVQARRLLEDLDAARPSLPVSWLRVVAVHALEAADDDRQAEDLARLAVTKLAAQKELAQVLDLAEQFGVGRLGDSGFALRYVDGVLRYHRAREAHGDDRPTARPELLEQYARATADLQAALSEADALQYPAALPDARRLLAWSQYFRGEFLAARDAFLEAEEMASTGDAADLLWMAIVSLDKVVQAGDNEALAEELARLIEGFLDRYPSSIHAPKLVLRQALAGGPATPQTVERLLAVPTNSEVAEQARSLAAQMLYRLFRDHDGQEHLAFGNQYLDVAVPLFVRQTDNLAQADELELARYLTRGRRILEVSLVEGIERLVAAGLVLESFDRATDEGLVYLDPVAEEILYRRLRARLYEGDVRRADAHAEQLWNASEPSIWARLAARALFRHGADLWRGGLAIDDDVRLGQDLVLRYGQRIVEEYATDPTALEAASVLTYHATVAEAAFESWLRSGDPERGRLALRLYRRLLEVQPRNGPFLRAGALLSEVIGTPEDALDYWRTLLAGTPEYSDEWYEAKVHQVTLLASLDPVQARRVLDQHVRLNPAYGPDPWGERLRDLDLEIPAPPGSGTPATGGIP